MKAQWVYYFMILFFEWHCLWIDKEKLILF